MLLIPDLQRPLGSSSVENMDSLRPWGRVFGNHWVRIVSSDLKKCTIALRTENTCLSNETTFNTIPWVLHCFCYSPNRYERADRMPGLRIKREKKLHFFPVFLLDPQNLAFQSKESKNASMTTVCPPLKSG